MLKFRVCVIMMLTTLLPAETAHAQDSKALGSRFFSATITRNDKPLLAESIFEDTRDNLIVMGAPLAAVIGRAYGVEKYQVVDAPAWVYEPHLYDIEATPPPATLVASDERQMLQSLLADRFELQTQRVTREMSILVLDTGAEELKLKPADTSMRPGIYGGRPEERRRRIYANINMDGLVSLLARLFGQPVLNLTGLSPDLYEILLEGFDDRDPATLSRIMLEQTGLVFELRTVPIEVLVVTAIEHPQLDAIDR